MNNLRTLFLTTATAALACATPLVAQQPTPRPATAQADTAKPKTTHERVIDKLRALSTAEAPPDTTRQDSLANPIERAGAVDMRNTRQSVAQPTMEFPTDSMMEQLLQLKDLTATQYRGATAVFRADSNALVLYGGKEQKAGVVREGQQMTADSLLTFDQNSSIACGYGKPVMSGGEAASPVESQQVCYDTRNGIGVAMGARTQVSQGANWFVNGDLYYKGGDIYGKGGSFTDCSLPYPHYHFAAGEIKVVNKDVMVARNVTLNFGDVPVFWLPFMMQSMKQGRRTGILMPQFSINDIVRRNSSYNRRISNVGFYWAISDYLGSSLTMDWWANNYTALNWAFDYNLPDKFMSGGASMKRFWQSGGSKQFSIAAQHAWQPDERTNLNLNLQYATSTAFVRETSFDPRELRQQITSTLGLSRRFSWGSVSMQGDRRQDISTNRIDYTLPSLGMNFSTVTLFPGEGHWYNNGTWTSSAQVRRTGTALAGTPNDPSQLTGTFSSGFSLGRLSWSQSLDSKVDRAEALRIHADSASADTTKFLMSTQTLNWNTSLSWTQRLIGTTTFSPGVTLSQNLAKRDTIAGNQLLRAPMRMSANASLKADLFAFLPGIGPLTRIRHRISPSLTYAYAPSVSVDSLDVRSRSGLFSNLRGGREQNTLSLQISQTFEGKFREDVKRDTANADSAAIDSTSLDPSKPRRLPQPRKVTILSLNTDALMFDFADKVHALQTTSISNSINSDLLRGLQLTVTHDLFKCTGGANSCSGGLFNGASGDRKFAPRLSRVSASFSMSNNSWLFKFLHFGKNTEAAPPTGSHETPTPEPAQGAVPPTAALSPDYGIIGTRNTQTAPPPRGAMGSWNASFNVTIERPRAGEVNAPNNAMTTINFTFQPTQMWNVSWQTGYSFTTKDFTDHVLRLTRQMHDWDANFDFVKAQNGNFSFLFNVRLRANPDIKFDYNQRTNLANRRTQ